MKRVAHLLFVALVGMTLMVGCSQKAETQRQETVTTPGGETTTTTTHTVEKSGDNPPPANP